MSSLPIFNRLNHLSRRAAVVLLFALAMVVKLAFIAFLGGGLATFPTEGTDVYAYDHIARSLLTTGVFGIMPTVPTVGMPPGEPFFLALLYAVSGYSIAFAKIAQVALLSVAAPLTFLIGRRLAGAAAFWAGGLIALDPSYIYLSNTFLSEGLYIVLMLVAFYLLTRGQTQPRVVYFIGAGICFGLAGLTRNEGWLFLCALWLGALITRGKLLGLRAATLVALCAFIVIAPWTLRNFALTQRLIPVSSEGGLTLWSGNNPEFVYRQPMPMSLPIYKTPSGLSDVERDNFYRAEAIEWILAHPVQFLMNGVNKVIALYNFDPDSTRQEMSGMFRLAGLIPYGLLLPFIALGLVLNLNNPPFRIVLLYILVVTATAFVFFGDSRIRAPIQPYLYLFGVLGVIRVSMWLQTFLNNRARVSLAQGESK